MRNQAPHRFLSLIKEPQSKGQVPLIDVTLVFMQKSLGNVFDSSTKQTREPSPDLLDYTIEPEFRLPQIFHRRGVLAAAREPDDVNPEMRSAACQFYIVWGRQMDDPNIWRIQDRLDTLTKGRVKLTPEMIEVYKTQGGTPHLDGQYTVFGEVLQGLDVVDKIQQMATDKNHRPLADVRILRATAVVDPFAPKPAPKKPQPVAPKRRRK